MLPQSSVAILVAEVRFVWRLLTFQAGISTSESVLVAPKSTEELGKPDFSALGKHNTATINASTATCVFLYICYTKGQTGILHAIVCKISMLDMQLNIYNWKFIYV